MRVLVVEDEPRIAAAIKRGLEMERFSVDTVDEAESGLSYGRSDDYDVLVLDRMLPGGDGLDVCRQLRKEGIKTPILMLTAKDQVPDRVDGLNAGADDYLIKPFSFDELIARIHALLRRPQTPPITSLKVADLELEPVSATVKRAGKFIELTAREFALLEYLMRHPGQVLSKEKLIQHVRNDDADVLPNTVEVYMGYVRGKVDRPFDRPLIKTLRGFGYKIEA